MTTPETPREMVVLSRQPAFYKENTDDANPWGNSEYVVAYADDTSRQLRVILQPKREDSFEPGPIVRTAVHAYPRKGTIYTKAGCSVLSELRLEIDVFPPIEGQEACESRVIETANALVTMLDGLGFELKPIVTERE